MNDNAKTAVFEFIKDRAPNWIRDALIKNRLSQYRSEEIDQALAALAENQLDSLPHGAEKYYRLKSLDNVTIRKTIPVGNTHVMRVLGSDVMAGIPEDLNEAVESLAEFSASLEGRFHKILEQERTKYWANIISLFGLFVAVFSLIIVSLPRLQLPASACFSQILAANAAQVLPVALVLLAFVFLLKWLFR